MTDVLDQPPDEPEGDDAEAGGSPGPKGLPDAPSEDDLEDADELQEDDIPDDDDGADS